MQAQLGTRCLANTPSWEPMIMASVPDLGARCLWRKGRDAGCHLGPLHPGGLDTNRDVVQIPDISGIHVDAIFQLDTLSFLCFVLPNFHFFIPSPSSLRPQNLCKHILAMSSPTLPRRHKMLSNPLTISLWGPRYWVHHRPSSVTLQR